MRLIQSIATRNGLFRNLTIPFAEGVTAVIGPNDSGKTYLAHALLDLLMVFTGSRQQITDTDWGTTFLTITFEHEGIKYSLTRTGNTMYTLSRNTGTRENIIFSYQNDGEKTLRDCINEFAASADDPIAAYLCSMDSEIFLTASFLASPMEGGTSLDSAVLRRLFINDTSRFFPLSSSLRNIFPEDGTSSGTGPLQKEIGSIEKSLKQIDKELQLTELRNTRIIKLNEEENEIRERLNDLDAKYTRLSACREEALLIQQLIEKKSVLQKETEIISDEIAYEKDALRSISIVKNTLTSIFPQFTKFTEIQKDNLSKIQTTYRRIRDAREEIECLLSKEKILKKNAVIVCCVLLFCFISAAAAIAVIRIPLLSFKNEIALSAVLALAGTVLASLKWIHYIRRRREIPFGEALKKKAEQEEHLFDILSENGITIAHESPDDLYEFLLQYFEEYGFYSEQESDMREMEQSVRDQSYFDEAGKKLQLLKKEIQTTIEEEKSAAIRLGENFADFASGTEIPIVLKQIDDKLKTLSTEREKDKELLEQMEEDISLALPVDDGAKALASERLVLEQTLLALYKKSRISHYIVTIIDEAVSRREKHLFRSFAEKTTELMHRLTSNQYISQINEDAVYDFITNTSTVSFNTQLSHMLTLCAKIALSDFLSREKMTIPLFIDAPSTYMDSQRIKNLIDIAAEYSKKRQIVILTHDRSLCEGAGAVVEL